MRSTPKTDAEIRSFHVEGSAGGVGLVRRRVDDSDRRVKVLEVTPEGRALRRRLERRLLAGIPGLDSLDRNEARTALAFVRTVNFNFGH